MGPYWPQKGSSNATPFALEAMTLCLLKAISIEQFPPKAKLPLSEELTSIFTYYRRIINC
jgi:hypothetical protein